MERKRETEKTKERRRTGRSGGVLEGEEGKRSVCVCVSERERERERGRESE